MRAFFQLLNPADGSRLEPIGCSRADYIRLLKTLPDTFHDFLVIVLVDDADAEHWDFSIAPVFTVRSFIEKFEVANV